MIWQRIMESLQIVKLTLKPKFAGRLVVRPLARKENFTENPWDMNPCCDGRSCSSLLIPSLTSRQKMSRLSPIKGE